MKPAIKAGVTTKLVVTSYSGRSYNRLRCNSRSDEARRIGLLYLMLREGDKICQMVSEKLNVTQFPTKVFPQGIMVGVVQI